MTVTHVEVSKDLRYAKVYVVAHDEVAGAQVAKGLKAAGPYLRRLLGSALRTKVTPELQFFADDQYERGRNIERLLAEIASGEPDGDSSTMAGDFGSTVSR